MDDQKKDERLLVEAVACRQVSEESQAKCGDLRFVALRLCGDLVPYIDGGTIGECDSNAIHDFRSECVHPHPGVPVADLLEELELWTEKFTTAAPQWPSEKEERIGGLRFAREAAQKPKGRWVWAKVGQFVDGKFVPADEITISEYRPDGSIKDTPE